MVDAAHSSIAIKKGLSIMSIGVINKKAIKVVAGSSGFLAVIKHPNKNNTEMER